MRREKGKKVFYIIMRRFKGRIMRVLIGGIRLRLLVRWEGIGIISYLLIMYLQGRGMSRRRGVNALISNRIGDAIILIVLYGGESKYGGEGERGLVIIRLVVLTIIGKSAGRVMCS